MQSVERPGFGVRESPQPEGLRRALSQPFRLGVVGIGYPGRCPGLRTRPSGKTERRVCSGYAIVGGVFFSTALTLFVVPAAYLVIPAVVQWIVDLLVRLYRWVFRRRQPIPAEGD